MIYDYYKQFPDVHPEIILKTDLNRQGIRFSQAALEEFQRRNDINWKGFHFFSYDMQTPVTFGQRIPNGYYLEEGSIVYERTNWNSPYEMDFRDGRFVIIEQGEIIADNIKFPPNPNYYGMTLEDGTQMPAVVQGWFNELLFITFNKYCELWNSGDECLFCDINWQLREQVKSEETVVARKDPSIITEVLKTIRATDPQFHVAMISGGTILKRYQGKTELEFYVERLNAVREGFGGTWLPTNCQIAALDDEGWRMIHETGVTAVQPNFEVYGKELFEWLCPGKAKFVGWGEWVKRTIRAVDFWGPGKVNPNFVLGIEMAQPHGFKEVKDALKSTLEGWDFLMSHGVVPRHCTWTIEPKSGLRDNPLVPLEYFIEVEKGYTELRWKYKYDPPYPAALTRTSYVLSCLWDWEYFHGNGPHSRKKLVERGYKPGLRAGERGFVA